MVSFFLLGGEQQRVSIVRALAGNAKILLADEPTGSLDSANTEIFIKYLSELVKSYGITTVIVSHDDYVCNSCSKKLMVTDGKIL